MNYRKIADENGLATYALVFDEGDEAAAELLRFAKETGVDGASFTGIGAGSKAVLGWYDFSAETYEPTTLDEQVELVSMIGDVATKDDDGEPSVHAHLVVAKRGGAAFGGHLMEFHVRPTLEVVLTETPTHLRKRAVGGSPVATIRVAESD